MDKSDQYDGSIAEQEKIIGITLHEEHKQDYTKKAKFASLNEIKNFERMAEIQNKKIMQENPTVFDINDVSDNNVHFVASQSEQYFMVGNKKEFVDDKIEKSERKWSIKIDYSNIKVQFILRLELNQMKRNRIFTIQREKQDGRKAGGFRFTLKMGDGTLALRVWIQLQGQYKIWKEMEIPSPQDPFCLQIHSFNNEQTDIKINDFVFHLILKLPYSTHTYYSLTHDNSAQIKKVEVKTIAEERQFGESETNCSNECQII